MTTSAADNFSSPPVDRVEFTGARVADVTFMDRNGAGQRNEFCRDLETFMDLMCTSYEHPDGALSDVQVAHNALGRIVKDAIRAAQQLRSVERREEVTRREAWIADDLEHLAYLECMDRLKGRR